MNVLSIENLVKAFGSLVVTNNVSLAIPAGERHVVIGPNGAGKTSLVNQIAGQLTPTSGRILLGDLDITGWPPHRITHAGVARTFQKNNLCQNLTVNENLRLAVQARFGRPFDPFTAVARLKREYERVRALTEAVHIERGERRVSELSYGEQRQLEIALALAAEPRLILLDEPTSGMAPAETERMIALIAGLPRSITLLMIEHDMKVVFSLADRITVLAQGEVLASGTPAEIQADPKVREVYLGGGSLRRGGH